MLSLSHDLRFALRTLRRRRLLTGVAVATIALGVGAATSIYSVVDGVLLRPLPFREPARLVAVWLTYPDWKKEPILAYAGTRVLVALAPLLFGVSPFDPWTFAAVVLVLGSVSLAASWLPARRAGRIEVMRVLRGE